TDPTVTETTPTTEPPPVTVPTEPPPPVTVPNVTSPSGLPVVLPPADPEAPAPPPEAPIPDPSPQVQVLLAKLHRLDVQHVAEGAQALSDVGKHDEDVATAARDAAQQLRDQRRRELAAAAASAYVHGGLQDTMALADPSAETYLPAATSQLLAGDAMA